MVTECFYLRDDQVHHLCLQSKERERNVNVRLLAVSFTCKSGTGVAHHQIQGLRHIRESIPFSIIHRLTPPGMLGIEVACYDDSVR